MIRSFPITARALLLAGAVAFLALPALAAETAPSAPAVASTNQATGAKTKVEPGKAAAKAKSGAQIGKHEKAAKAKHEKMAKAKKPTPHAALLRPVSKTGATTTTTKP